MIPTHRPTAADWLVAAVACVPLAAVAAWWGAATAVGVARKLLAPEFWQGSGGRG